MKPYHSANLKHQPYSYWRVILLAYVGKVLGVQFHVCGLPFGAAHSAHLRRDEMQAAAKRVNGAF
jgi:hypothetical protein